MDKIIEEIVERHYILTGNTVEVVVVYAKAK